MLKQDECALQAWVSLPLRKLPECTEPVWLGDLAVRDLLEANTIKF